MEAKIARRKRRFNSSAEMTLVAYCRRKGCPFYSRIIVISDPEFLKKIGLNGKAKSKKEVSRLFASCIDEESIGRATVGRCCGGTQHHWSITVNRPR